MPLELKTVLRCEHGEVVLPNCGCTAHLSQLAEDAREMMQERDRIFEALVALVRELPRPDRHGNAPGHSHTVPGVWDKDNGLLAGQPCRLCAAYAQAISITGARP